MLLSTQNVCWHFVYRLRIAKRYENARLHAYVIVSRFLHRRRISGLFKSCTLKFTVKKVNFISVVPLKSARPIVTSE